jgi:hypothetical protein
MADDTATDRKSPGLSMKVSAKGALSVYGLGRFPVTLYKEQWKRLLAAADEIRAFAEQHDAELKTKGAAGEGAAEGAAGGE